MKPRSLIRLPTRLTAIIPSLLLALPGCTSLSRPPDDKGDGTGCSSLVGRYADTARSQAVAARSGPPRDESLSQVLGLDPSTGASVPVAERAVEVLHVAGNRYSLALSKTTPPDAVVLWDAPLRCVGGELDMQTEARYESTDGVHIVRQKVKVSLSVDADSTLILQRTSTQRAVAVLEVRRGGSSGVEYFRFPPLENRAR